MLHTNSYFPRFLETENYVKQNFEILKIIDIAIFKRGKKQEVKTIKLIYLKMKMIMHLLNRQI